MMGKKRIMLGQIRCLVMGLLLGGLPVFLAGTPRTDFARIKGLMEQAEASCVTDLDKAYHCLDLVIAIARSRSWWEEEVQAIIKKADCAGYALAVEKVAGNLRQAEQVLAGLPPELADCATPFRMRILEIWAQCYYYELGDFQSASAIFSGLIQQAENAGATDAETLDRLKHAYLWLYAIHNRGGNYQSALEHLQQSAYYESRLAEVENRKPKLAYLSSYLAPLYQEMQQEDSARFHYFQYLSYLENNFRKGSVKFRPTIISTCNRIASFYQQLQMPDSAVYFLKRSLNYHQPEDPFYMNTCHAYGLALQAIGAYAEAETYFQRSIRLREAASPGQKNVQLAQTQIALADLYAVRGNWDTALEIYHEALRNLAEDFDEKTIFQNPGLEKIRAPRDALPALYGKSRALYECRKSSLDGERFLNGAWTTALLAVDLIDRIKLDYTADFDKKYLLEKSYPIYEWAISLAYERGEAYYEKAFELAEKSKATLLFEAVRNTQAEQFSGVPPRTLEQIQLVRATLRQYDGVLDTVKEESRLRRLQRERFQLQRRYEQMIGELEQENSAYFRLKYDLSTLPSKKIRRRVLGAGQALIEYFVGEKNAFAFLIDASSPVPRMIDLKWNPRLSDWASTIKDDILQRRDAAYIEKGRALYEYLLRPVIAQTAADHLIIIPDGKLGYIPFDALLTREIAAGEQNNFRQFPYLLHERRVSQCFSASMLYEMQRPGPRGQGLLAFAPAYRDDLSAPGGSGHGFRPLKYNQEEAAGITQQMEGILVAGDSATRDYFLQLASRFRLLHLASHARVNDRSPTYSYIAFSNTGDTLVQPYRLYVHELYNCRLPADMVVLSACETGAGQLWRGEGIISIARAFSYAGAHSILTTLWRIDDQYTKTLMLDFYRYLGERQPKDRALQQAKLSYLETAVDHERAHPRYWAAFTPIGDMGAVQDAPVGRAALLCVGGLLLVGAILGAAIWLRSRRGADRFGFLLPDAR